MNMDSLSVPVFLNYYPFKHSFYTSFGVIINKGKYQGKAIPNNAIDRQYWQYTYSDVDISPIQPYLGIGFGNHLKSNKKWSFTLDIGAYYAGKPKEVTITPIYQNHITPAIKDKIDRDVEQTKQDIKNNSWPFYPLVILGVSYHF